MANGQATDVKESVGQDTGDQTYTVALPFGSEPAAEVTVAATASDGATITVDGQQFNGTIILTLNQGKAKLVLTVTAEDGKTTRTVTINFTTAEKELITSVSGIADLALPKAVANAEEVIAYLEKNVNAEITSNGPSEFKVKWEYKTESNSSAAFNPGSGLTNKFDWKIVYAQDGADAEGENVAGTITVTNHTTSTDATLATLQYKIGDGAAENITIDEQTEAAITITVPALPFGTTAIALLATPTDPFATVTKIEEPAEPAPTSIEVTPFSFPVTINAEGNTEFKLKVTAEDQSTIKTFTLTFSVEKEKITAVTVPATYKLPEAADNVEAAIALLQKMDGVVIKTNGTTPMKLKWTYENNKNEGNEYTSDGGKTNVFSWSVVRDGEGEALAAVQDVVTEGTTMVTNFMPAVTGTNETVEISKANPVDKIGDGTSETT